MDDASNLLKSIVEGLLHQALIASRTYPGTVVSSNGTSTVDVVLDKDDSSTALLPDLVSVEVWQGTPGIKAEIVSGSRVLIGFLQGDLKKPFAIGWQADQAQKLIGRTVSDIDLEASTKVILEGSEIDLGRNAAFGVARLNDPVVAGGFTGTITPATSLKVKAG